MINGGKCFISGAGLSDVYLVMCRTGSPEEKGSGVVCFEQMLCTEYFFRVLFTYFDACFQLIGYSLVSLFRKGLRACLLGATKTRWDGSVSLRDK